MDNFQSSGVTLKLTAPSGSPGGVVSGEPYLIGNAAFVIALESKDAGDTFDAGVKGVYLGNKVDTEAWSEGQVVRWDDTARKFTEVTGSPENRIVGYAAEAVAAALTITNTSTGTPQDLSVSDNVLTVNDYTGLGDIVITISRARDQADPVVYTLTEGVDFDAETSNEVTADNIAAAIDALLGLTAAASTIAGSPPTEIVTVTADNPVHGVIALDGFAR